MGNRSGFIVRVADGKLDEVIEALSKNLDIKFLSSKDNLIFGIAKSSYPEGVYVDIYILSLMIR